MPKAITHYTHMGRFQKSTKFLSSHFSKFLRQNPIVNIHKNYTNVTGNYFETTEIYVM